MVEITITIPAAAYEWYDQIVESYGGIYDNVQDYISCQVSGRWREETNTWEGGYTYGRITVRFLWRTNRRRRGRN